MIQNGSDLKESLSSMAGSSEGDAAFPRKVSFRDRILTGVGNSTNLSEEDIKTRILEKRKAFKWLHIKFDNDIVYGSWYFVWGSALCMIIPIFPLVSIYRTLWDEGDDDGSGVDGDNVPTNENAACYGLLIFVGLMYTIGSYAFVLASRDPPVPALFSGNKKGWPYFYHFHTDELLGTWCFYLGTIPIVPILGIFAQFSHGQRKEHLAIALIVCIIFSLLFFFAILSVYPASEAKQDSIENKLQQDSQKSDAVKPMWLRLFCPCLSFDGHQYLVPICKRVFPVSYYDHIETDWLIVCWMMYYACLLTTLLCVALLIEGINRSDAKEIYDYSTGLVDMVLFTIASMYFVAGSYEVKTVTVQGNVGL